MYAAAVKSTEKNKGKAIANNVGGRSRGIRRGFGFVDNRPEAITQKRLHEKMANNRTQAIQQTEGGVCQRVTSAVKLAAGKLTFDDLIWGNHADHYATEAKYVDKGKKIVEGGKVTHTTFLVDRQGVTKDLIAKNIKKNGWMDNPPAGDDDFILSPSMEYVRHDQTPGGIVATYGHGSPVVRVRADIKDLKEATGDNNGADVTYYSPYHLQDVRMISSTSGQ